MSDELGSNLVFVIVVLGVFLTLVGIMSPAFFYTGKTYAGYAVPAFFSQGDIQSFKYYKNATIQNNNVFQTIDFNPQTNYVFEVTWNPSQPLIESRIRINYQDWGWWIFKHRVSMQIENQSVYINLGMLQRHLDVNTGASAFYPVTSDKVTIKVWFTDTNESRNSVVAAWNDGYLTCTIGIGMDTTVTAMSSWDIVGRLLTFQSPDLLLGNSLEGIAVTSIIVLGFWVMVAYLIYRLVLMAIPFVGGG